MEILSAVWGLFGIMLLLINAIYRLTPLAFEALRYNLLWYHWLLLAGNLAFMVMVEGYLGFYKSFAPRAAARAKYLKDHPAPVNSILGPLFCMGYFNSPRKRKITSLALTTGIVLLIIFMRKLAQPWRGIIDLGVVAGLAAGVLSLAIMGYQAFFTPGFNHPNEVVEK